MSTIPLSGTIVDAAGRGCRARIAGLASDGSARVTTNSDDAGRWQLPEDDAVTTLVGVWNEDGIAATSAVAAPDAALVLPRTLTCSFDFDGGAPYTQIWLDPLKLDQLDDTLLPALRAGQAGSIVLHVGSFDASARRALQLQAGRYKFSGGRIAIHPGGDPSLAVSEVIDLSNGQPLAREAGDWLLQIRQDGRYRVRFSAAPGPRR
jgi:hypothetical protein